MPEAVPSVTNEGLVVLAEGFIQILMGFYLKKKRQDLWPFKFHTIAFICAPAPPSGLHGTDGRSCPTQPLRWSSWLLTT